LYFRPKAEGWHGFEHKWIPPRLVQGGITKTGASPSRWP